MMSGEALSNIVVNAWRNLQESTPLVHCITNTVVQPLTANVLLAGGASPAMVDIQSEAGGFRFAY